MYEFSLILYILEPLSWIVVFLDILGLFFTPNYFKIRTSISKSVSKINFLFYLLTSLLQWVFPIYGFSICGLKETQIENIWEKKNSNITIEIIQKIQYNNYSQSIYTVLGMISNLEVI